MDSENQVVVIFFLIFFGLIFALAALGAFHDILLRLIEGHNTKHKEGTSKKDRGDLHNGAEILQVNFNYETLRPE